MNLIQLADLGVSDNGLVSQLVFFLLVGLCVALVWVAGRWFIGKLALPPTAMTIWTGLFLIIGLIVVINFLLGLGGHAFLRL